MSETTTAVETTPDTGTALTATPAPAPETRAVERLFASRTALPGPPEVSPDGRFLAYLLPNAAGTRELWLTPLAGGDPIRIDLPFEPLEDADPDTGRANRGPQWSPDGAYLALTGRDADALTTSIWLVPMAGHTAPADAEPVPATTTPAPEPETEPTPAMTDPEINGETAAPADIGAEAAAPEAEPDPALQPDTGDGDHVGLVEPMKLLDHPFSDRSPRWSPDGTKIAFVHTAAGRDVIALIDISDQSDGIADILTWTNRHDRDPQWSRDGKFLAFTRQIPGQPEHNDIVLYTLETREVKDLTGEKPATIRHSLEWVPGRNLVAYATVEGDWLSISVVNADNRAGWVVTRESGDKTDFRFAQGEPRMVYVRSEGFATVVAERGLHASGAVAIDPGEGVARYPRWTGEKRVVYAFSAPQKPFGFLMQETLASSERHPAAFPVEVPVVGAGLRHPVPFEFDAGPDEQFSGLVYRTEGGEQARIGAVYMPDGPLTTRLGEFQIEEQALASSGITVLSPVIHGSVGFGQAVEHDLHDLVDRELEANDLVEAGLALVSKEGVAGERLAIVGHGFGGTLALVTAGARPGVYRAVVAIDPITDWRLEFAEADAAWRTWLVKTYGLPAIDTDAYALRTPGTFAAVIDVPVLLVQTDEASEGRQQQLAQLTAYLDESGVAWERIDATGKTIAQTLQAVAARLEEHFAGVPEVGPVATTTPAPDGSIEPASDEPIIDPDPMRAETSDDV